MRVRDAPDDAEVARCLTVGRVDGKVAMVTGGAGGIGEATARALAEEGASVAVVDIDGARAADVAGAIEASGAAAVAVQADLAEESGVVAAIESTVTRFGRLDVLHNNAALTDSDFLSRDTQVTELALEVWERTMAVNLRSQMLTCKHAVPEMVRNGGGLHRQHVVGGVTQGRPDADRRTASPRRGSTR